MDVIFKQGMLYLQGAKFGKRTWRKIWTVLFKPSPTGVGRLELYTVLDTNALADQKKATRQKAPERKVVRLSDFLSVSSAPKESCPQGCTAFYLITTQCTYTLASTTSDDWLSALRLLAFQKDPGESDKGSWASGNSFTMEDNDLYSSWQTGLFLSPNQYPVTVQSTEASKRCNLAGEYLVSLEREAFILLACNTGGIICSWPYRLLRKFGPVEGGFGIEAGRRCQSGEGVFIFLTRHGSKICQAILEQCFEEKRLSAQPASNRSSRDYSPVLLPTPATPLNNSADVAAATEDNSEIHYSIIDYTEKSLSNVSPQHSNSKTAVGKEGGDENVDEDEQCHSLVALSLDDDTSDIYYNLRRTTPPVGRRDQFTPDTDDTECIYSDIRILDSPSKPPQPPPPNTLLQPVQFMAPRPRYQFQPPVTNFFQPVFNAEAQLVDDMKEMEEAINSSTHVTPSEPLSSFKHRLAEIISKDLAKHQPPPSSGADSPTFSQ